MPRYEKNFLADVIVRLDFPSISALSGNQEPVRFEEGIISIYPTKEPVRQFGIRLQNRHGEFDSERIEQTVWTYKTADGSVRIELTPVFLVIGFKKYLDINDLKLKVSTILTKLFSAYEEIGGIKRLGLRYVDKIVLPNDDQLFDWSRYLNPNLIKNLDFISNKNQLRRVMQSFELMLDNDINLNFKCGIFNSWYPDKLLKKEFFIDTDCYTQIEFPKGEIMSKLDAFHEVCSNFFEDSITQEFRNEILNT